ncbi:MAG: M23 family metallopeptidase [Treponema sp.]|jgi:murein DD-endopeptidase MepM/ murein hydrolase activator NlpD|nr:M23 family metallopeptidase [Treponema sp.]
MEIISYNVTNLANRPVRTTGTRLVQMGSALRNIRQKPLEFPLPLPRSRSVAYPRKILFPGITKPDLGVPFRRLGDVLNQYRMLCLMALAGAVLGMALVYFDTYDRSFAPSLSISRFSILESGILDQELTQFILPPPESLDSLDDLSPGEEGLLFFAFTNPVSYSAYTVQRGDTISGITVQAGLKNISTLIAVNDIDNARQLRAGQKLKIPSIDGISYEVQKSDTLAGLSARYGIAVEDLLDINDLMSNNILPGQQLFIPGAQMDAAALRKAMGELFVNPLTVPWRLTSLVGYRINPLTGTGRQYHNGLDMAASLGSPIRAAMSGTVVVSGYHSVYGNYVIINHGNGYQTMYGHMSKILVRKGQSVGQGTRIGLVGSTGQSTGYHLHFTVYKNGKVIDPRTVLK